MPSISKPPELLLTNFHKDKDWIYEKQRILSTPLTTYYCYFNSY